MQRMLTRIVGLTLAVALAGSPVLAADNRGAAAGARHAGFLEWIGRALGGLVPVSVLEKGRSTIDPNGSPPPAPASPDGTSTSGGAETDSEGRSTIDPNG